MVGIKASGGQALAPEGVTGSSTLPGGQRGIEDTSSAGGKAGLEAEYVFWNMTQNPGPGYNWADALPVIAANPIIQTSGNDRYLWRRASDGVPIGDRSLRMVIP